MKPKHTPGPWHIDPVHALSGQVWAGARHVASFTVPEEPHRPRLETIGETHANAILGAAAPDLLAALQEAVKWAEDAPAPYRDWPFIKAARAAIAKAT